MSIYEECKAKLILAGVTYPRMEEKENFMVFLGIIRNKKNIENAGRLLYSIMEELDKSDGSKKANPYEEIEKNGKLILTAYMITSNHEEVIGVDKEESAIVLSAHRLCKSINDDDKQNILLRFQAFSVELTEWKRDDSIRLAHELGRCYQELKMTRTKVGETIKESSIPSPADEQWYDELENQMESVLRKLKGLREDWENFVDLYDPERMNMIDPQKISEIMEKAFWDKMKLDLESIPPSFESSLTTLEHLKTLMTPFAVCELEKNDLEEVLDIDYIKQRIENGCFDHPYMGGLITFVTRWIRRLEAPQYDEDTDNWSLEMQNMINNVEPPSTILAEKFFPRAIKKINEIIDVVMAIHNHSQNEDQGEGSN
jgi:hypothetical protein